MTNTTTKTNSNSDAQSQNSAQKSTQPNEVGDRVIIFDTTLRDGEQSPGASMTLDEKFL